MDELPLPFGPNYVVTWADNVPDNWRWLYTPGPMTILSGRYHDGTPSEYAKKFGERGVDIKPGWILLVEFKADDKLHYNPPLRLLIGEWIQKEIHEMWLKRVG